MARLVTSLAGTTAMFAVGAWAVAGDGAGDGRAEDGTVFAATMTRIDGTTLTGQWIGSSDGPRLEMLVEGSPVSVPVDDLSTVAFVTAASRPAGGEVVFHLADGGRLAGELVGGEAEVIVARIGLGDASRLRFDRLAGVRLTAGDTFPRADELFRGALASRLPGQDVLITREAVGAMTVRGRLEILDAEQGSFALGDRLRTFQTERIFGVVFAKGVQADVTHPVTVVLVDGSVFSGRIVGADFKTIRVDTSLGFPAEVAVADVALLKVRSDRLVYLSDLALVGERGEGLLHSAWPMRRDRSVADRPLSIGGRVFEKGLGVHSRTELVYELGGAYETFVATIGIDDAVGPRGSVIFRVLGDDRVLYDSGLVTGADEPRRAVATVSGVSTLALIVDYGDGLDLSDQADWGEARLLKP